MNYIRTNWLPILVILVGFGASLALALAPLDFLLANTVPDDSFYYFQIARNIVHGLGSTFDGVNLTNGYHPLWLVMLLPIYHFFSTGAVFDAAPIHAALVLSAIFSAALGFVLLQIVSRYTREMWIKALALAVWFFNPYNLYHSVDGLETALSMLLIGLFILCAMRVREHPSLMRLVVTGLVGGLMMLARLDNLLYFVMFLLWLMYDRGFRASMREVFSVGIIATIVIAPWLLFNFFVFGMFLTSASAAYTIVSHRIIYQDNGYSLFQMFKAIVYMTDYSLRQFVLPATAAPSVFLTLLGVTIGWLLYTEGQMRRLMRSVPLEPFLVGGTILNFVINASIRWSPREWYFIAFNVFLTIWIAWLLGTLRESGRLNSKVVGVVACLVLSLYYIGWSKNLRNAYYTSNPVLGATLWANDNLPKDAVLGAWNAGVVGYFSTHRLINLDGLVNNRAYEAIRDRHLWDYVQSEHIAYIIDVGSRIDYRMKSSLGIPHVLDQLEAVHETVNGPTVYKVK